jgi:3D (Asp-Asp-Asp) domain-containing protein
VAASQLTRNAGRGGLLAACGLLALAGCGNSTPHARPLASAYTNRAAPAQANAQSRPATHSRPRPSPGQSAKPAAAGTASCGPRRPAERQITRRQWLSGVIVTEYYPVPERWSDGRAVATPGLTGRHRADWLYSAKGVSMEGDGVDLSGHHVHIADLGSVGWVNARGRPTVPPSCGIRWSRGAPYWRAGGWRNAAGEVTYPLHRGGWASGAGHWVGGYGGATFSPGPSLPLTYYHSVAVDPRLIPRGSRVYIGAYRGINGGWFVAQDTGGAIIGRHIDVYRPPTRERFGPGRLLLRQRVYVIPPGG